jgi:diguanylate cyclase (GGDEF)-like protein/PAS domain S-box-containing protein
VSIRSLAILAVVYGPACALWSQQYSFKHYGQAEGLRNAAVECLLQDRVGYLWVGTQNGLFRYDGWQFRRFGREEGLPSAYVRSLHEAPDGTLWVATRSGLVRVRSGEVEAVALPAPVEILVSGSLASDGQGQLYIGTGQGLLVGRRLESDSDLRFGLIPPGPGLPRGAVYGVHVAPGGVVWFGCGTRLCSLDRTGAFSYGPEHGVPEDRWDTVLTDPQGRLWVRSTRRLLVRRRPGAPFQPQDEGLPQAGDFGRLALDRQGRLFVPTDRGVAFFQQNRWVLLNESQGLQSDGTSCLLQDREGSIWIGLRGAGLARWLGYRNWEAWTRHQGLSSDVIWAMRRDPAGALWVGTSGGLNRILPDLPASQAAAPAVWTEKEGLGGNQVRALQVTPDGAVWMGSHPGGVTRLDPHTGAIQRFDHRSGLTADFVLGLFLDQENRLWVSTRSGLFRSTPVRSRVRFERQFPPLTDDHEIFFQCIQDRRKRIWATGTRGLACWDQGVWKRYTSAHGLRSDLVGYVAEAGNGALWIGYREPVGVSRGFFSVSGGPPQITHFNRRNGLHSDQPLFVGVDRARRVWIGTDDGVDALEDSVWRHYGSADGLIWNDCDGSAFLADDDGTVWIGTSRGLARFRPSAPPGPEQPPPVLISHFEQRGASLTVEFTALSFLHESRPRFQYRLRGLEENWTETSLRQVRYSGLPGGDYTLEVRAGTPTGLWSEAPAQAPVHVPTSWWRSKWAWISLLLSMPLTAFALYFWRMSRMIRRQQHLEAVVSDRTAELRREKERYRAIVDTTKEWIWAIDAAGRVTYSNAAVEAILGYGGQELTGLNIQDLLHPADRQHFEQDLPKWTAARRGWTGIVNRWLHRDGSYRYLESNAVPILDDQGVLTGYRGADRDITARRRAEEALRESEERYALAVRGANDGLWDWDLKGGTIYYSPRWKTMLGYDEAEIGASPEEWFSRVYAADRPRFQANLGVCLEGLESNFQCEYRMVHKNGSHRWILSRGAVVCDAAGKACRLAGSQTDITARKLAEERLYHGAFHDELTGLANRALLLEHLEHAAQRAERKPESHFAVLFLDVDRFKLINDSLGHHVGDQLLMEAARRLQHCLRPADIVARLGGDEFVVLAGDLHGLPEATQVAERLQAELNRPFTLGGHEVITTASIGIALSEPGNCDPECLLRNADTAMYRAKALGKARHHVFHSELHAQVVSRLHLQNDLRKGLERGEFLLYYQPVISGQSGRVTGVEALVRWRHPERGLLCPGEFIPLAEETGLIQPLSKWVLRAACRQNHQWQKSGLPPADLAVNISARQFNEPGFPAVVASILQETGLAPRYLQLELTESVLLHYAESTARILTALRDLGVRISVDDFGTGYSSLRYLLQFPIDTLKLDQSFVRDIVAKPDGPPVVKAIIELAHGLGLRIVAEGVETVEQMHFLQRHRCDEMQGFVFREPVPAEEAELLLGKRLPLETWPAAVAPNPPVMDALTYS